MFNSTIRFFYSLQGVELNPGSGGAKIAVDVIAPNSFEVVKQAFGAEGTATMVDAANPLPVSDNVAQLALATLVSNQQSDALTNTELRASPIPVSGTVTVDTSLLATAAKQDTGNGSVASIDGKTPALGQALAAASVPVVLPAAQIATLTPQTDALTNIQLRASPIPVSGTVTVDTSLLATAAKQDTGNTSLASIKTNTDKIPSQGQAAMAASMPVTIASDQTAIPVTLSGGTVDNTSLYSNSLSATGAITGINTTGYASIMFSFTGTWAGNIFVEGSADNSVWEQMIVLDVNEIAMQDIISENGIFQIKSASKFIRINVVQINGTVTVLILGRTVVGLNAADSIAFAMDKTFGMPLYVEETGGKRDNSKALIPSDAPAPIYGSANGNNAILMILDTTGYQSVSVQFVGTWSATIGATVSNDGVTYVGQGGFPSGGASIISSSIASNSVYIFPASGRYFKLQISSYTSGVVQCLAFLRQQPVQNSPINYNMSHVGGTTTVNGGLAGSLAIGGTAANGATPTMNPVLMAGVDSTPVIRRLLTDTGGRLVQAGTDSIGTARGIGVLPPASNNYNVASQAVVDVSNYEGQSFIEILAQLLVEMRINNQYLFSMPETLQRALNDTSKPAFGFGNEPSEYRNEPSLIAV